jgi:multiple sugar transport system permease protein
MRVKRFAGRLVLGIAVIGIFMYFTFPLFWVFWTSIKPKRFAYDPGVWVFMPTFAGYRDAIADYNIPQLALNSVIVSLVTVVLALLIGTVAAYAMVRFRFRGRKASFFYFLAVRFIPPIALVLPLFLLASFVGLLDTRLILILAYQILTITFTILMMRGFIQSVPVELEEAARLEGCSQLQAFVLITLPIVRGGLFATAVFLFLYSWNEFPYALFLTTFRARTLPTGVEYFLGTQGVDWNAAMAYGFMSVIPVLVVAVFLRQYLIQGLTFGVGTSK